MAKKYIDADLLKKEMEKRMHICDGVFERDSDTYYQGKAVAYQETLSFLDSLQQEQPSEDLEEATARYGSGYCDIGLRRTAEFGFKSGAEWQKSQMIRDCSVQASYEAEIEKAEERGYNLCKEQMGEQARKELLKDDLTLADLVAFDEGCKLGRRLERQQMLKDAVEGFIFQSADYYPKQLIAGYDGELGMGDKVKIVIIPEKEDEK